jgi:hypothetical protein
VSASEPVECQNAIVLAEKSCKVLEIAVSLVVSGEGGYYNLIGNVVPDVSIPVDAPLGVSSNVPSQQRVAGASFAADPASLQLGEMALEEADLVFAEQARWVGRAALDAEVVEDVTTVDGSGGLRDQLGAAHGLAVPVGRAGQGDLGTLLGAAIGGVLVAGVEVDVLGDGAGSVLFGCERCYGHGMVLREHTM